MSIALVTAAFVLWWITKPSYIDERFAKADALYVEADWSFWWPEIDEAKMLIAAEMYASIWKDLTGETYPEGDPPDGSAETASRIARLRERIESARSKGEYKQ